MENSDFLGILGMTMILVFFLLNQTGRVSQKTLLYDGGNALGAALLCVYAFAIGSVPFLVLNLVWAGFSLRDVIFDVRHQS